MSTNDGDKGTGFYASVARGTSGLAFMMADTSAKKVDRS